MKLPFGKYRERELVDVPRAYLDWLLDQEWPDVWTKPCVQEELELRREVEHLRRAGPAEGGLAIKRADVELLRSILDIGYRGVKLRSHPGTIKRLDNLTARLRVQLERIAGAA